MKAVHWIIAAAAIVSQGHTKKSDYPSSVGYPAQHHGGR